MTVKRLHPHAGKIRWKVLDSQKEAERRLRDNTVWGAIVVPEGFSAAIATMGTSPATAKQAELRIPRRPGAASPPSTWR